MKTLLFEILLALTFFTVGCKNIETISPQTDYVRKVVVRAELVAGTNFAGVSFTQTLPVNEIYDTSKAILRNVTAYIKVDGTQILPLVYSGNGIYKPVGDFYIRPETIFELFAQTGNTLIYAKTKIPQIPQVVSAAIENKYVKTTVKSNPSEVYGAQWILGYAGFSDIEATDFLSIISASDNISTPDITVSTTDIPEDYLTGLNLDNIFVRVYAFDYPYQKYFDTKNNNQPVSNAFVQGGDRIAWNVQGNNVIGLFIGVAKSGIIKAN